MVFWMVLGCSTDRGSPRPSSTIPEISAEDLADVNLSLLKAEGYEADPSTINLAFSKKGWVSSYCGCNSISGQFSVDENILKLSSIQTTQMLCIPPPFEGRRSVHGTEAWMAEFLSSSPTIFWQDDLLVLSSEGVTLTFGDPKLLPPEKPQISFYETVWVIDELINAESPLIQLQNDTPSVIFYSAGRVEVNTGCNRGVGKYTTHSESVTINVDEYTEATCSPASLQQTDQFLRALFWGPEIKVEKNSNRLTLRGKKGGVTAVGTSMVSE